MIRKSSIGTETKKIGKKLFLAIFEIFRLKNINGRQFFLLFLNPDVEFKSKNDIMVETKHKEKNLDKFVLSVIVTNESPKMFLVCL